MLSRTDVSVIEIVIHKTGKPNLHIHGKLEYINSCTINVDTKRDLNTYKVFRAPYGCTFLAVVILAPSLVGFCVL